LRRQQATTRPPLRSLAAVCALVALALLILAPNASAHVLTPQSGSPNANRISNLYTVTLIIAAVIFVIVEGTLLYALVRFRARKRLVAAQIHGNTRLEVGWTIGAAVILIALAVVTFAELDSIREPEASGPLGLTAAQVPAPVSGDAIHPPVGRPFLTIQVNGQQFLWRYSYLNYPTLPSGLDVFSYYQMVVPTDTTVVLKVVSQDVVHSWWVPDLGGKVQAVPGYVNWTWFRVSKAGTYYGQCGFICGLGHARMKGVVTALPPSQFVAWIHSQTRDIVAANSAQAKARAQQQNKTGAAAVQVP
jgi:cytochrome c oxidase subunit 2